MVFSFFFFFSTCTVFLSLSAILPLSLDATNHFSELNDASSESIYCRLLPYSFSFVPYPFSWRYSGLYTSHTLTTVVLNKYYHPLQLSLRALSQFSVSIFQRQRATTIFSKLQFRKVHQNIVGLAPLDDHRHHPRPW